MQPAAVAATPSVGGRQRRPLAVLVMTARMTRPVGVLPAVLAVLVVSTHSLPSSPAALEQLQQQPKETLTKGAAYLAKFGWLDSASDPTQSRTGSLQSFSTKLAEFQRFAGLPISGVMDDATVSKMQQPRCGVTDKPAPIHQRRGKRHALQGSRWRKRNLSYKITSWPLNKDQEKTRKALKDAFQAWEDVSALTFTEISKASKDRVNIDIRFEYSDHGDGDPFDGPGGTLAHAFFPIYGGAAHFDKSENFTVDPGDQSGVDLFTVATHEFGHSLGLAHSEVATALMAPFYQPPSLDRKVVKEDDLNGIQELYGKPPKMLTPAPGGKEEVEEEVEEKDDSTLCTDSSVDAMLTMTMGGKKRTFAFKGEDYWRITDIGVMKDYPKKITVKWGGVPGNLDAVLVYAPRSSAKETLFFFKGKQVWRMTNVPKVDAGYPKLISKEFKGIPNDLDAAFTWKENRRMYFFKGTQYWRFNYEAARAGGQGVSANYPRDIRLWEGVPNNLDTVNTWKNGRTYFFKGNSYYKISDRPVQVASGYPRSTGVNWFRCSRSEDSSLMTPASQQRGAISAEEAYRANAALEQLQQQPKETLTKGAAYLAKFGWLDSASDPTQTRTGSLQSFSTKLAEFQRFAGLPVSGLMDDATVSKMQQPRCGVPDKPAPLQHQRRRKRFVLESSKWPSEDLTYTIINWPRNKDQGKTKKALQDAFQAWADVSALTFTEVDKANKPAIDIRFETGDHGDRDPFDGRGGTLAHAFFPRFGGDAHFDDSENFLVEPGGRNGVDLFTVATHEFGHSLGLLHSEVNNALMAPFYAAPPPDRKIVKEDDIKGIQKLYGAPKNTQAPAPDGGKEEEVEEKDDSTLCTDSSVDAMLTMKIAGKKRTFAFKGEDYWQLTDIGVMKNYPKKIADAWGGVPGNLDAVLVYAPRSSAKETLFFFKGKQVWRMTNVPKVDAGYPKLISKEFKGVPNDIDAAFTWKRNRKMYFFKGTQYWRFDYKAAKAGGQGMTSKYPQSIRLWKGMPSNLDSVSTWKNRKTYFFKGNNYYKILDRPLKAASGYPRSTGVNWFGCSRSEDSLLMPPASQQRGDISAEEAYKENVIGYGKGDTQPRRDRSGAAGLLPSLLPSLLLYSLLLLLLPAALAAQRSWGSRC